MRSQIAACHASGVKRAVLVTPSCAAAASSNPLNHLCRLTPDLEAAGRTLAAGRAAWTWTVCARRTQGV